MSRASADVIAITPCSVFMSVLGNVIGSALVIYYLQTYQDLPDDLKDANLSKLFLAYIILSFFQLSVNLADLWSQFEHCGEVISRNVWNRITLSNRYPFVILKLGSIASFYIGIYFCSIFIPISSNNCSIYEGHSACNSLKIISVLMMIGIALVGLSLIICLCATSTEQVAMPRFTMRSIARHPVLSRIVGDFSTLTSMGNSDDACAICMEKPTAGEQWKQLHCGHKYHPTCIDPWLVTHRTCPICRKPASEIVGRASGIANSAQAVSIVPVAAQAVPIAPVQYSFLMCFCILYYHMQ